MTRTAFYISRAQLLKDNTRLVNEATKLRAELAQALGLVEDARAALRSIAEGNLGDASWQANYETIKQIARNALSNPSTVGEPK